MLLPLDTFRSFLGAHPWHWWQLAGSLIPIDGCDDRVFQYAWQDTQRVGRDDIATAIAHAEDIITRDMGFAIAPHFRVEETRYPAYFDHTLMRANPNDAHAHWSSITTKESWVSKVGLEKLELLGTVNITLSDADGDGVLDTFTSAALATTLAGVQIDELELYIAAADRINGEPVSPRYRIAPASLTISGGNLVATGSSYLCVKPLMQNSVKSLQLDVATTTNYVTTLDVYHHYCDPTGTTVDTCQAVYTWETQPYPYWGAYGCCGAGNPPNYSPNSLDPAAIATLIARANVRDGDASNFIYSGYAIYDTTLQQWAGASWGCRPPDRILVRYQAGYPLSGGVYTGATLRNGQVNSRLARIACMLAAAELPKPIDACSQANRTLSYWQFDLARSAGANDESYGLITRDMLNCPYGTRRGHVYAWKEMQREEKVLGIAF